MHVLLSITFDPSEFCPSIYVNTRIPVKNVSVDKNIIDQLAFYDKNFLNLRYRFNYYPSTEKTEKISKLYVQLACVKDI